MVFVSKKQRQNLINFLNDANLHTFFYFLKNPLAYYNILTFRGLIFVESYICLLLGRSRSGRAFRLKHIRYTHTRLLSLTRPESGK